MPFSRSFLSEEHLLCSICLEVFDNPVSTPCGHSFCMSCIGHYWDMVKNCQCPLCKQTFKRKPDLHINRTLREITEQFKCMNGNMEACGGAEGEKDGITPESMNGTLKLPNHLFSEMKRKLIRRRSRDNSLACHDKTEQTEQTLHADSDGPELANFARQVSLRRYSMCGAANAMKVPLCPKHHRNLELFCKTDLECICVECGETEHQTHNITCAEKQWQINKVEE